MFFLLLFGSLVFSLPVVFARDEPNSLNLVYRKSGNITLTGIFSGRNCDHPVEKSLEEMASAIWTVEVLNSQQYLYGVSIGLSLFETCVEENSKFDLLEEDLVSNDDSVNVGILTSPEIYEKVVPPHPSGKLVTIQHLMNAQILVDLVVQLLTNLQWTNVDMFITDSEIVLDAFNEKTSEEGICVHDELLISNSNTSLHINNLIKPAHSSLIVIIAAFTQITTLMNNDETETESKKLILLPSDFVFHSGSGLPKHAVVLLPSMKDKNVLSDFIDNDAHQRDFFNHKEPTKSPLFVGVAATILKLLRPLKEIQDDRCEDVNYGSRQSCVRVVDFMADLRENKTLSQQSFNISTDDVANTLRVLKIDPSPNDEMFLYIASLTDSNSTEDIGVFQIFNLKTKNPRPILLMINDELLKATFGGKEFENNKQTFGLEGTEERKTESESLLIELFQGLKDPSLAGGLEEVTDGQYDKTNNFSSDHDHDLCRNFRKNFTNENGVPVWRSLAWVSVNTGVGFMGIACTLSIMVFIVSRFCRDDMLEGSPYFTLTLMFSVVIMFGSSLPFHVQLPDGDSLSSLVCGLRVRGPGLVYAIPFSLMLSRSLMLASSEGKNNFASHINGYLQTTLSVFMFGVQLSLTTQQWVHETADNSNCSWAHPTHKLILSLGYDILLLVMLICATPFIIRSRRNYKEGLFISISVYFIAVVWSAWIAFYFLLPQEQKDAAVAIGLNSTAAVLLLFIFIPRTYLMVATIVRDRTVRSLPSLDRNVLSVISDPNYVSQQSLNDLVFGTITYKTSEVGFSNPNFDATNSRTATRENCSRESVLD